MKKNEQMAINAEVKEVYEACTESMNQHGLSGYTRLRTCQAHIQSTYGYELLWSYNTLVACYDHETGKVYDFLRMVYGYTSTSAQHISKFAHDIGQLYGYKWSAPIVRYYPL